MQSAPHPWAGNQNSGPTSQGMASNQGPAGVNHGGPGHSMSTGNIATTDKESRLPGQAAGGSQRGSALGTGARSSRQPAAGTILATLSEADRQRWQYPRKRKGDTELHHFRRLHQSKEGLVSDVSTESTEGDVTLAKKRGVHGLVSTGKMSSTIAHDEKSDNLDHDKPTPVFITDSAPYREPGATVFVPSRYKNIFGDEEEEEQTD